LNFVWYQEFLCMATISTPVFAIHLAKSGSDGYAPDAAAAVAVAKGLVA
jgi:methanogenic corrinoid protein MtbC1